MVVKSEATMEFKSCRECHENRESNCDIRRKKRKNGEENEA
jgi:hypothetical protein